MNRKEIASLRESIEERRSAAVATLRAERVSKARLRWFLEHACNRCEIDIDMCRYSYESMIEDALEQVDGMYEDAIQALDMAAEIREMSGRFPEWAWHDLRLLDRDFLRMQWSNMKPFMFKLDQEYDFWLDLNDPNWADEFPEFAMAA
jgi:hypothetical protein